MRLGPSQGGESLEDVPVEREEARSEQRQKRTTWLRIENE